MGELNSLHCIFLITSTELFFTKVAPMQSVTDTALLGFSLILLPGMFVSYYTIIYFFVKYFLSNVHNSLNTVFECSYLSFGWEIGHPLSMHVTRGSSKMFTDAYRGGRVSRLMYMHALTLSLFMFLSYGVLLYL